MGHRFVLAIAIAAAIVAAIALASIAHFAIGMPPGNTRADALVALVVVAAALAGGTIIGRKRDK